MRNLEELGFIKTKSAVHLKLRILGREIKLPPDYLHFLLYEPPQRLNLVFEFVRSDTQEVWEGQVTEFVRYDNRSISDALVKPSWSPETYLLPIAVDAGGNELYLNVSADPMPVIDVDYGSGAVSIVAPTFGEFIDLLSVAEF
jgi:hypothetical protein